MHCQSLFSHITDEESAIRYFRQALDDENLAFLICYYTQEYNPKVLHQSLRKSFPNIPFHGASSCQAVMTEQGYHAGPVIAMLAIYDSREHAYGTGLCSYVEPGDSGVYEVNQALDMALLHANRVGEVPNLILLHSTPGCEEEQIKALDERLGTLVPIIGGSAADNEIAQKWSIMTTQGTSGNGVSMTLFFSSQPVEIAFSAGHIPTKIKGIATKTDQRCLMEIDHRPALEVYREWMDKHSEQMEQDTFLFGVASAYPIGRVAGKIYDRPYYKLSHPVRGTENGGLETFTTIKEGEELYLMKGSRENLVGRAARVVSNALNQKVLESPKIGAINIFCAGPMRYLKQDIDSICEQLNKELDELPFICPFTFGEQGRFIGGEIGHGNLMISSAVFHKSYE
ncbi:FIST N-terminal domain-containing protein [Vibrio sp. CAU 1672]|uniref:FIST signal transduction protein n=1 Tax=Vibrio sp. CAU 1672 TaxID=3032594 RepID=UPI0023DBD341|nr:FIST N-terminal domain-containing protein [Vibrio sp. CAU 1672]MDF2152179.1 FIST N-terminal domain-containing protein [Vibrio sp. CAU 1672]